MRWFRLDLNPEPWAIGPVGYSRRGGKMSAYVGRNQQLDAYKEAVRESITRYFVDHPEADAGQIVGPVELRLYFWRNRAEYSTPQARTHRKHEADLTNLQKATEDALQDYFFANDRDVKEVHSFLIDQSPSVEGRIIVGVGPYIESPLPDEVLELLNEDPQLPFEDDSASWSPPEEMF